jgi:sortase A
MEKEQHQSRFQSLLRWTSHLCLLGGGILLVLYAYVTGDARIYQALQSKRFALQQTSTRDAQNCQALPVVKNSSIGRLEIPRIGLSVVVLDGDDAHTLRLGAGLIPGTAWPAQTGNVAIAAHRDTFFRGLREIRTGDLIRLLTMSGRYTYRVEFTEIVASNRTDVLNPTIHPTLTLITCYPFSYIGPAPDRFVVRATLASSLNQPGASVCPPTDSATKHSDGRLSG